MPDRARAWQRRRSPPGPRCCWPTGPAGPSSRSAPVTWCSPLTPTRFVGASGRAGAVVLPRHRRDGHPPPGRPSAWPMGPRCRPLTTTGSGDRCSSSRTFREAEQLTPGERLVTPTGQVLVDTSRPRPACGRSGARFFSPQEDGGTGGGGWRKMSYYDFEKEGIELVRLTVERSGRQGRLHVFDVAVSRAVEAVQYGWALGESVEVLRQWLAEGAGWAGEALDRGQELDSGRADSWLVAALVAGDRALAERVAARVPEGGFAEDAPVARQYLDGLARLVRGDTKGAVAAAAAMAEAARSPRAHPETVEFFEGLDRLLGCIAARDQVCLDDAVEDRSAALVRQCKRSVEMRRFLPGAGPGGRSLTCHRHQYRRGGPPGHVTLGSAWSSRRPGSGVVVARPAGRTALRGTTAPHDGGRPDADACLRLHRREERSRRDVGAEVLRQRGP